MATTTTRNPALARLCWALFALSTLFPIVASGMRTDRRPNWLGALDVAVALALAVSAMVLATRNRDMVTDADRVSAQRVSQRVLTAIPVLLAIFFIVGDRLDWTVLVIGLAWRGWLLVFTLPFLESSRTRAKDR
jgi:hypothetical protein